MWAAATSPTATPPSMWWTAMNKGIAPPPSGSGQRSTVLLAGVLREPGLDLPVAADAPPWDVGLPTLPTVDQPGEVHIRRHPMVEQQRRVAGLRSLRRAG